MEQSVNAPRRGADIPVAVEHQETIAVLQDAARPRRQRGRGNVERILGDPLDERQVGLGRAFFRHLSPRACASGRDRVRFAATRPGMTDTLRATDMRKVAPSAAQPGREPVLANCAVTDSCNPDAAL